MRFSPSAETPRDQLVVDLPRGRRVHALAARLRADRDDACTPSTTTWPTTSASDAIEQRCTRWWDGPSLIRPDRLPALRTGRRAPPPLHDGCRGTRRSARRARASGSAGRRSSRPRRRGRRAARRRTPAGSSTASNSGYEVNHRPPPERSQCSRVGPQAPLTRTGNRSTQASITTRENDSSADGETATRASRTMSHLSGSLDGARHDDVGVRRRAPPRRARRGRGRAARGGAPCRWRSTTASILEPLCSSTRPDADDVGTLAQPQQLAAGPAGALGVAHTETEHDLGSLRHRVHPLDEGALGRRVEAEGVRVAEACRGTPGGTAPARRAPPGGTPPAP